MQELCKLVAKVLTDENMISNTDTRWTGLQKIAKWRKKQPRDMKEQKLNVGRKAYEPMVRAILLITELMAQEDYDQETVETWTVKKIYAKRMSIKNRKKKQTPSGIFREQILNGQMKWTNEQKIVGEEWEYIWELSRRTVEAQEGDLHDALYKLIARRMIVPVGKRMSAESGYKKCPNCPQEDWSTKHALIRCMDVQDAWRENLDLQDVTARDILQVDRQGKKDDRWINVGKNKKKIKADLSAKEVTVLSALKEVVDEVERRKKRTQKRQEWKKMEREEWKKKIEIRVEKVMKRLEERRARITEHPIKSDEEGEGGREGIG